MSAALFALAIMVVAASRPVLQFAASCTRGAARLLPLPGNAAFFFVSLSLVPVLMVAQQWSWDLVYMLGNFGWKAALAFWLL